MNPDEACCICGLEGHVDITITDEGGGSFGRVCNSCKELLESKRCALCGDHEEVWSRRRNGTVHFDTRDESSAKVCPDCRYLILDGVHGGIPAVTKSAKVDRVLSQ